MSTILHKHVYRINFENFHTLKIMSCQNLKFYKVSKGVSKIVLKSPLEDIFHARKCGILYLAPIWPSFSS
jgi:hypothetical protein